MALFIRDNLNISKRNHLAHFDEDIESVYIEIDKDQLHTSRHIIKGVIYRPPNRDIASFNDKLCIAVERMKKENRLCYLLGDYNIQSLTFIGFPRIKKLKYISLSVFTVWKTSKLFLNLLLKQTGLKYTASRLLKLLSMLFTMNWWNCLINASPKSVQKRNIISENLGSQKPCALQLSIKTNCIIATEKLILLKVKIFTSLTRQH